MTTDGTTFHDMRVTGVGRAVCQQAVQNDRPARPQAEREPEAYPRGYVEDSCELRTPLAGIFNSPLIQRGDGERYFIRQQERDIRLVCGVRLDQCKQRHRLRYLARWQGQQNWKVDQRRHCRQAG